MRSFVDHYERHSGVKLLILDRIVVLEVLTTLEDFFREMEAGQLLTPNLLNY